MGCEFPVVVLELSEFDQPLPVSAIVIDPLLDGRAVGQEGLAAQRVAHTCSPRRTLVQHCSRINNAPPAAYAFSSMCLSIVGGSMTGGQGPTTPKQNLPSTQKVRWQI